MFQPRHYDSYTSSINKQRIKCKFPIKTSRHKKENFQKKRYNERKRIGKEKGKSKLLYILIKYHPLLLRKALELSYVSIKFFELDIYP